MTGVNRASQFNLRHYRPLRILYVFYGYRHRTFMSPRPTQDDEINKGSPLMLDLLVAVLGTGGILLMVAYAALCERI